MRAEGESALGVEAVRITKRTNESAFAAALLPVVRTAMSGRTLWTVENVREARITEDGIATRANHQQA